MSRIFRNLTLLWILVCWAEKTIVTFFQNLYLFLFVFFLHNNTVYLGNTCIKHNSLYGRKYCPPRWPILCPFGSCFLFEASGLHRLLNAWAIRYSCKFEKKKTISINKNGSFSWKNFQDIRIIMQAVLDTCNFAHVCRSCSVHNV